MAAELLPTCPAGLAVTGSGSVDAVPDLGTVTLQVSSLRPTADQAQQEAAKAATAVTGAIATLNGINSSQDISTTGVTLNEQWDYGANGDRSPKPTGCGSLPKCMGHGITRRAG